ncbi:carbohydrate binding domain-containing protein [Streptomyces sp. NPDC048718]|uniref:carbohydrate binding domain-containing protein n=1 Tax=Streptomyces sp. NPDC048718 TaxID=3365587 RepID=UPI003715EBE1
MARITRTVLTLVVSATLSLVGTVAMTGTARAVTVDVGKNGGFENGLADWSCSGDTGAVVSSPVRTGTGALRATPTSTDDATCTQTVEVRPNTRYELSAWVRGPGFTYIGAQNTGTTDVYTMTSNTNAWKELPTYFITGASTTSVQIYTRGKVGTGAYSVDDVKVLGDDGVPGPEPTIPDTPTGFEVGGVAMHGIGLSWDAVPGATAYRIYRDGVLRSTVTGIAFDVIGLTENTTYQFEVSAINAAGESPKSAPVSMKTESYAPPRRPWAPRHEVTGYWQNFDNGAPLQKLRDVPPQYDVIAVSFAESTPTPGQIGFTLDPAIGYASTAEFKADITAKKIAGKSVILSVGGESGNVTIDSDASAIAFANSAYSLMREYGFSGVDIALDHGVDSTYLTKALRQLSAKGGPNMFLSLAPQALDMQSADTEYFKTALAVKDILTVVNTRYYNTGSLTGCDGKVYSPGSVDFLAALTCVQLEAGLHNAQVGFGVPASPNGPDSGYTDPQVVNDALTCLIRKESCGSFRPSRMYPDLHGPAAWSTNWDATGGNAWSNAVGEWVHGMG